LPVYGPVYGPDLPPVHGPDMPPVHGPDMPPVHGPVLPPLCGPVLPPLHGPFPSPDREGAPAIPVQRTAPDERPAIEDEPATRMMVPLPRRGAQAKQAPPPEAEDVAEAAIPAPREEDAHEPVQLELALVMEQRPQAKPRAAAEPELIVEQTICIPHPRKPRW